MRIIANRIFLGVLAFCCFVSLLFLLPLSSASAFQVPERLEYSIWWGIVKAGNSTLEISDNGDDTLKIVSRVKSSAFLSIFYKVEDLIELTVDDDTYVPYDYYINLREGKHRRERRVTYDRESGKITLDDLKNKNTQEFEMDGEVYDPLSAFYMVRTMDLEVGKSESLRVFDNGKLYDVEVQVLKKETVHLPHGTFDTIKIKPVLMSEGIFVRKGDVFIWVTDDEKKIPVKVESKVKVGSIHVELKGGTY
jgi:hypothetical protein